MWRPWSCENESIDIDTVEEIDIMNIDNEDEEFINTPSENVESVTLRKKTHLCETAKRLVKTVYKNLIERGERAPLKITSELTEVPYSSVRRIVSRDDEELARKQTVRSSIISKLGETGIEEIKALIYGMYDAKQVPTIATIKTHLLEKAFPADFSEETLRIILHRVGFTYKKLNKRCAIMQTPRLITWRTEYIRKIRQFRSENRNIMYLNETWYDTHDVITRGWVDDSNNNCRPDTPVARGKRIIILAAGNERGFIPGTYVLSTKNIRDSSADYHDDMNHQVFEDWFKNYLLPQLEPNSVIVMDNAPYHSRQDRKIPNMGTKKADMVTFMEEEKIFLFPTNDRQKKNC